MPVNRVIDKLAYIHILNRRILITRSRGKGVYYIPGGKREIGESDHEALIREVSEELNVHLKLDTIEYAGTFEAQADGKPEGVIVKMTCYRGDYDGELSPASEIEEIDWFSYQDKNRTSAVDHIIFDWLKGEDWID